MEPRPLITLTTDFGYRDPFVGIVKGTILSINPSVQIIDITHDISPQSIMETAFVIEMSYRFFPYKTIHTVIVDPGVGSERRPLLVAADHHYFIGPDNGVFSRIYDVNERLEVFHLTADHYFLPRRSSTFHGRDIFAPAAAWFSKGIDASKLGNPVFDYVNIPFPVPKTEGKNIIDGEIIHVDRFGNLMTNVTEKKIEELSGNYANRNLKVVLKDIEAPLKEYYSEGEDKKLYSLINSFGYLELFVNAGNASANFGVVVGEKVRIVLNVK